MDTKRMKPIFGIIMVLLLVTLACGTTTDTDTGTEPLLGSDVATEAPVESAESETDNPYYREEFDGGLGDWTYFTNVEDDVFEDNVEFDAVDDTLWFNIDSEDTYVYLVNDLYEYEDVEITVEAESRGRNNNFISLVCRYDENIGWYEFNIAANGLVSIYRVDYDDGYIPIGDGGSEAINQGQDTNTVTATCKGDALTLTINGEEWRTFHDNTIKRGLIGVSAGSYNVTPVELVFNWLEVSEP